MSRLLLWIIIAVTTIFSLLINIPNFPSIKILGKEYGIDFPLRLGLDLQGGTQLILQTQMDQIEASQRDDALESAKEVIERRVNLFGVSEAVVQTSKVGEDRRILVELPGLKNATEAAQLVGKTAQLDFRELPATASAFEATGSAYLLQIITESVSTELTGADLQSARVVFGATNQSGSGPQVEIIFTLEGAQKFAEITKRNTGKPLAIFLDDLLISAPTVQQEIVGGNAVITGQFSSDEAKNLAIQLNAGALPVPIKILEQRSIGPTLGQESINKSLVAGGIGLTVILLYMGLYYGVLGVIADFALIIYTLIILAIFKTGLFIIPPITLTLAGIAALILSIGMAVDANILIFERMKEEIRWGKSRSLALELGFRRAWSSIWASNVSSLITAAILYGMGQSVVRGFAVTLTIGVLVSMFTAVVVTRTFLKLLIK